MISHKHKFIFIHVPKAGGTSIEATLAPEICSSAGYPDFDKLGYNYACGLNRGELNGGTWRQHFTYSDLKSNGFTRCTWDPQEDGFRFSDKEYIELYSPQDKKIEREYFKFAFVRNPLDKLVSEYSWRNASYNSGQTDAYAKMQQPPTFKDFILNLEDYLAPYDAHRWPQHKFIYDADQNLQVDFVGRFENFQSDLERISKLLGDTCVTPSHLQATSHKPYQSYYTPALESRVREIYQMDFKLFNY